MRKSIFNKAGGWRKAWRHLKQLPWQHCTPGQLTKAQNNRTIPPLPSSRRIRWLKLVSLFGYMTNPDTYIKATLMIIVKEQRSGHKPSEAKRPEICVWEIQGYSDDVGKKVLDLRSSISCLYCHTSNCQLFVPLLSSLAIFQQMGFLDYTLSSSPLAAAQGSGSEVALSFFPYPVASFSFPYQVFDYERWDKAGTFFSAVGQVVPTSSLGFPIPHGSLSIQKKAV